MCKETYAQSVCQNIHGRLKGESRKEKRRKQSFVSMSSVRQTKYGRSSYCLGREQIMLAKEKREIKSAKSAESAC